MKTCLLSGLNSRKDECLCLHKISFPPDMQCTFKFKICMPLTGLKWIYAHLRAAYVWHKSYPFHLVKIYLLDLVCLHSCQNRMPAYIALYYCLRKLCRRNAFNIINGFFFFLLFPWRFLKIAYLFMFYILTTVSLPSSPPRSPYLLKCLLIHFHYSWVSVFKRVCVLTICNY